MSKTYYEHLGSEITDSLYRIDRSGIHNSYMNKPKGGLWGCRLNNRDDNYFDWRTWCTDEDFHADYYNNPDNRYIFSLKENSNILIFSGDDILPFIKNPHNASFGYVSLDEFLKIYNNLKDKNVLLEVENCKERKESDFCSFKMNWPYIFDNYDGFELLHGEWYGLLHYNSFYTWDCDSIVIWNPEIVNDETYIYREIKKNGIKNPWE